MVLKSINFLKTDIWKVQLENVSKIKSFSIRLLRIVILAIQGFDKDNCTIKAAALTFYTLLSIVPLLAMIFGIAKGLGFDTILSQQLMEKFAGQEEVITRIIDFAQELLKNTKGGLVSGIGVAVLVWTVVKLLSNIENAFNDVWGISKARTWKRKFSDYLSSIIICPLLFVMAGSMTMLISSHAGNVIEKLSLLRLISPFIMFAIKALPFCVVWALFTFLYVFMPNTKVKPLSGILAGIVAGSLYQVLQFAYISFQVGVSKYNAIYGGFAALPLFLIWLEISWLIVLVGAEISFAYQNVKNYELENMGVSISYAMKKLFILGIVYLLVKNFKKGGKPLTSSDITDALKIPVRIVQDIFEDLVRCGIASEVRAESEDRVAYQPARDIETFTIKYVLDSVENNGVDEIGVSTCSGLSQISKHLKGIGMQVENCSDNVCLKDI